MDLELLKEFYFFELERKQQLESSLVFPVAVLTALGGVVFSLAGSFRYGHNLKTYVFVPTLAGAIISVLWVVYYLVRATHRFTYELVPSASVLLSFYEDSTAYYRSIGAEFKADQDFEAEMKNAFARATSKNHLNNISKAGFLYRAHMGLVAVAIFSGLSGIAYFADAITRPHPVHKIELVNAAHGR